MKRKVKKTTDTMGLRARILITTLTTLASCAATPSSPGLSWSLQNEFVTAQFCADGLCGLGLNNGENFVLSTDAFSFTLDNVVVNSRSLAAATVSSDGAHSVECVCSLACAVSRPAFGHAVGQPYRARLECSEGASACRYAFRVSETVQVVARYAILTRRRTTNLRPRTDASAVSARARAHALPSRARAHTCTHHAYMERRCGEWERKPKVWFVREFV